MIRSSPGGRYLRSSPSRSNPRRSSTAADAGLSDASHTELAEPPADEHADRARRRPATARVRRQEISEFAQPGILGIGVAHVA